MPIMMTKTTEVGKVQDKLTKSQSSGLAKAEKLAIKFMAENEKNGKVASNDQVYKCLSQIDRWPTQSRPNISSKPVTGMCLGLVYGLGGQGPKNSKLTQMYPELSKFVVGWTRDTLPTSGDDDDVFPFSSLQINYNYGASRHVDKNNVGPSYITSIGPHTGGKLWCAETYKDESLLLKGITYANNGPGIIDCHNQWKLFNGCAEHETTPFKDIRISFVAFTSCWYNDLSKDVADELDSMGFTAFGVGAIGFIDQIYEQYRKRKAREEGTKGYMCKSDSKTFNTFVKDRQKNSDMAPPKEPGCIAVECYGREAVRGGGWVSYAICKDEINSNWTPETKMIHNKDDEEDDKMDVDENASSTTNNKNSSNKKDTKEPAKKKKKNNDAVAVDVESDASKLQNGKRGGLNLGFSRSGVSLATDPKVAEAALDAFTKCADASDRIFLSRQYMKEGNMKVKEENGKYRSITLYRHRIIRSRVVLAFGGGEFEGIGANYSFKNGVLADSDGDKIEYKDFVRAKNTSHKRLAHDPVKKPTQNPQVVELDPNRVGIWCLQFSLSKKKGSRFLKHVCTQRFNFYQNLPGETASFCSYVRSLKEGDICVCTITDTAAARTRPLGIAVYEALRQLGAPSDMIPIKYRQAWSLIGYKGANCGDAIVAQGARSTLLRVIAKFGRDKDGKVIIVNSREIQTSMSKILKIELPKSQQNIDEETLEKCRNKSAKKIVNA
jgi:hypothetical protein